MEQKQTQFSGSSFPQLHSVAAAVEDDHGRRRGYLMDELQSCRGHFHMPDQQGARPGMLWLKQPKIHQEPLEPLGSLSPRAPMVSQRANSTPPGQCSPLKAAPMALSPHLKALVSSWGGGALTSLRCASNWRQKHMLKTAALESAQKKSHSETWMWPNLDGRLPHYVPS